MKNLFKRSLAVVLAFVMCVSMMNLTAFAAPWGNSETCSHEYNRDQGSNHNENGYCMRTCTKCGTVTAFAHEDKLCQWHGVWNGNPENHGDGYCDYCHYEFTTKGCPEEPKPGCDHDFSDSKQIKAPTCTHDEERQLICSKCGIGGTFYTELNSRLGHETQTLTCDAHDDHTSAGNQTGTHSWTCSRCNGTETGGKVDPTNYTYAGVKQSNGATKYTCTACGHWYEVGCNHKTGTGGDAYALVPGSEIPGNCEEKGSVTYQCNLCGHTESRETDFGAHNYVTTDTKDTANTTISQDGANGHYWVCTRNASHAHTATVAHTYGEWDWEFTAWVDDAADDSIQHREANGTHTCTACGYEETANVKHTDSDKKGLTNDDLTRRKGEKTFDVAYLVLNGGTSTAPLAQTTVHLLEDDDPVDVEIRPFTGYTFDHTDRQTISYSDNEQLVVHVYYTYVMHNVTWVNYNGEQLADGQFRAVDGAPAADTYAGNNPTRGSDGTYTYAFRDWSDPAVDADGNVTYTAQYTPTLIYYPPVVTPTPSPEPSEEVEVTEPPTPLNPTPELPDEPDQPDEPIEVDEPDTPLAPLPELPDEPVEVEIEDPDTPLAAVPQTGDNTVLWATTAVASGAGLIWLAVDGKKRREDAE